ncbi:SusC/RagA family TonB-linked outer membrane protein [Mucilaginibacter sp.]|uniref:SusC/RagA family TonB-linked outer membrane protein n=1 Tax=Mucilaginibacter sp. TaxID=1882438 RepID=UPI0035BBBCC6
MKKLLLVSLCFLVLCITQVYAQNRTVTGTVTAKDDGLTIPGVTVRVKGTTIGTQTNAQGAYTLSVPSGSTLVFASIGFTTAERSVGESSVINIVLNTSARQLEEVVVTTAGITRAPASLGAATATVSGNDIAATHSSNLLNGLTSKAPGLQIVRSSGGVNSAVRVTLRGQRSFSKDAQPLFVVDGIPVSNSNNLPSNNTSNTVDVGSRIGDINVDDIESATVLPGPNAAALYGTLGVNGAIVITTKNGKNRKKKTEINFSSSYLVDQVQKLPTLQNDFGSGYNGEYDPIENTNWGPRLDPTGNTKVQSGPVINGLTNTIDYKAQPNNAKDFFNKGQNFQNSISFASGTDKTSFYGSFSDVEQKGVIPLDKFRRNTVSINGSAQLSNKFNVGGSIKYNRNITNTSFQGTGGASSAYQAVLNVSRQIPLENYKDWRNNPFASPDGFFDGYYPNPYYALENNRFNSSLDRVIGTFQAGYDPFKWLNITYRLGTDISSDNRKQTFERTTYGLNVINPTQRPTSTTGSIIEDNISERVLNSDLLLTFKKDINKDFSTTLILLNNVYQTSVRNLETSASAIAIPGFFNLNNAVGQLGGFENYTLQRRYSFAGDLTVDFRKYLFLNATLRNDRSSTLPVSKRSYFYPSVSLSYLLTESIPSLKNNDILSFAKIRGSYARVGQNANPYSLVPTFGRGGGFPYGSLASFGLGNTFPNPDLAPEFTTSYEVGTELAFFNDRIGLEVTGYQTNSTNQIVTVTTATSTGYTGATLNAGEIENKGIEVALRGKPFSNRNGFGWNFTLSYSHNDSKVKSLYQDNKLFALGSGDPVPVAYVGQQFPTLYGSDWQRDEKGRVIVGANGNPLKNSTQNQFLGQVNPKHIFGFSNTFSYKGFSLNTVLDYRTGNVIYSGTANNMIFTGSTPVTTQYNREPFVFPNSVIKNADGSFTPNTTLKTADGGFDFWYSVYNQVASTSVIDAAYLKLRQIYLEYQLPKNLLDHTPFGNASIALSGSNILLWTPKSNQFIDPDASIFGSGNQGREYINTPSTRTFGINLKATF